MWVNNNVKQLIKDRQKLFNISKVSKSKVDWNNFKEKRNLIVKEIREAKISYYGEKIDKSKRDSKKMWKIMKEVLNKSNGDELPDQLRLNDVIIKGDEEIANKFNDYFIDSIKEIVSNIQRRDTIIHEAKYTVKVIDTFQLISTETFNKIILILSNKKETSEGISTDILKIVNESRGENYI